MAAAAAAAAWFRGALTHHHVKVSSDPAQLHSPWVNVIHVQRPIVRGQHGDRPELLLTKPVIQVVINASNPEAALTQLLQHVQQPEMQQLMHEDLQQVVHQISSTTQRDHVRAKLEVISRQSCPNWHADSVGIRMLCTYHGPGTWYLSNKHVTRLHNPWTADVTTGAVDEQHAVQAAQGDWLYLKGNSFPGLAGAGAVHKSPELADGQARLLLTVDDACCSSISKA